MGSRGAAGLLSLVAVSACGARTAVLSDGTVLGTLAVIAATTNIVGGFMITDRMLKMFKRERHKSE